MFYLATVTTTGFDFNPVAFAETSIFPALSAFTYATHCPRYALRSLSETFPGCFTIVDRRNHARAGDAEGN